MSVVTFQKLTKLAVVSWFANAATLTICIFALAYTKSIQHWSEDAWYGLVIGSTLTKIVLSIFLFVALPVFWSERVSDKDKAENSLTKESF